MKPAAVHKQILGITTKLIQLGLCNEQNYPAIKKQAGNLTEISISGAPKLAVAMKNVEYREIYETLDESKSYNARMLDGGLLQMLYVFSGNDIATHRLAYFPAPDFEAFQNDPEIYLQDEIYGDILLKNVVPFPLRFDFNADDGLHVDVSHPKSHLTLGQYQNCRIPVSGPVTPIVFAKFILRHFYNTAYHLHEAALDLPLTYFHDRITESEQGIPHLRLLRLAPV